MVFKGKRGANDQDGPDAKKQRTSKSTPKNIIFCFDGTGQDPKKAVQPTATPEDDPNASSLSNVAKLHLLFGGDFERDDANSFYEDMKDQVSLYYSGVGTYGSQHRRLLNAALALDDVTIIIKEAVKDLRTLFKTGDKIFVTGFSRGAAIARKFCSVVSKTRGLRHAKIEFLFVFDTVASIGLPDLSTSNRPASSVLFEDRKVAPNVVQALHCVSIDDKRRAFQPTLMNAEDRVTEVWFAGNHGDIGGGWYNDGLSDVVLQFVLDEFQRRNVSLRILAVDDIKLDEISKATKDVVIEKDDIEIKPDFFDINHEQPMHPWHYHRKVVVIRNDRIVPDELPVVHHSVAERILGRPDFSLYRPQSLVNQPHKILLADGTLMEKQGLNDHLPEAEDEVPNVKRASHTGTGVHAH